MRTTSDASTRSPHRGTDRHRATAAGEADRPPQRGFRGWAAGHPLTAFLVITFSVAYPLMALPILAYHGVIPGGSLPAKLHVAPDEMAGALLTFTALVPATLFATWATDGREGLRRLLRRMVHWRVGLRWWLVALAGLPLLTTGFALLLGDSLKPVDPVDLFVSQLGFWAVNFFVVNLWEETAWAGFFQTRLERRHNIFVAALITAVPFGFVHWPLAFFGDVTAASVAAALALYVVLGVIFRPMLAVMMRGSRDSILVVAVLHSMFNRTNNEDGIAAAILTGDGRASAIPLAVVVLTATTALVIRRRLSRAHRHELDAQWAARRALPRPASSPVSR
jgi:membrane protease YdiL (CAAX protease family)